MMPDLPPEPPNRDRDLGAPEPSEDLSDIELEGDLDELDHDLTGPETQPGIRYEDAPERTGKPRARSPYQASMRFVHFEISNDWLIAARAWGSAHPVAGADADADYGGYPDDNVLMAQWVADVIARDLMEDELRDTRQYDWGGMFAASLPDLIRQHYRQAAEDQKQADLQAVRREWLSRLTAAIHQDHGRLTAEKLNTILDLGEDSLGE